MSKENRETAGIWTEHLGDAHVGCFALLDDLKNDVPTEAQLSSLINLTTAIAKYYNIDPLGKTHTFETNTSKEPYIISKVNYNIM